MEARSSGLRSLALLPLNLNSSSVTRSRRHSIPSDAVIVLSEGEVREAASRDELFEHPKDPYTQSLLSAVPDLREHDYPGSWGPSPLVPSMEGA